MAGKKGESPMPEITDKIQELQQLFRDRFGVDVNIGISIFSPAGEWQKRISRELANHVSFEVASQLDQEQIRQYKDYAMDDGRCVTLRTKQDFALAAFYDEE